MRGFITLIFLTLVFVESFPQANDSIKCWSSNDKLTWNDFKGKVDTNSRFAAICPSNIKVYPILVNDSAYQYRVKVIFFRYKAWHRTTTTDALAHEQLHFDITELYARKLRKMIKDSFAGEYNDEFGNSVKKMIAESLKQEGIYDERTMHGADKESQAEWSKKIHVELESLKEYATTAEDCATKK
jgi:hypothetical protein